MVERKIGLRPFAHRSLIGAAILIAPLSPANAQASLSPTDATTGALTADLKPCANFRGPVLQSVQYNLPQTNVESEVEIGQSMVSSLLGSVLEGPIVLESEVRFRDSYMGADFEVAIPAGVLQGVDTKNGRRYPARAATFKYDRDKKPRGGLGKPDISLSIDHDQSGALIAEVAFGFVKKSFVVSDAAFSNQNCLFIGETGFRKELLYSGVSKGTISIEYREFSNNMARPAFSQELKYDLAEGDEIGFRGARFRILKATNLGITYTVLRSLD